MRAMISNKTKQNTVPSLRQQSPQKTLPAKRTINLAAVGQHKIAVKWAALGIVLIITAAVGAARRPPPTGPMTTTPRPFSAA